MQIVEPAVVAHAVTGALLRAMIAQLAHHAVNFGIVSDDCPSVAKRAQILLSDEANVGCRIECREMPPVPARTSSAWGPSRTDHSRALPVSWRRFLP